MRLTRWLLAGSSVAAAVALGVTVFLLQGGRQSPGPLPPGGRDALAMREPAGADSAQMSDLADAEPRALALREAAPAVPERFEDAGGMRAKQARSASSVAAQTLDDAAPQDRGLVLRVATSPDEVNVEQAVADLRSGKRAVEDGRFFWMPTRGPEFVLEPGRRPADIPLTEYLRIGRDLVAGEADDRLWLLVEGGDAFSFAEETGVWIEGAETVENFPESSPGIEMIYVSVGAVEPNPLGIWSARHVGREIAVLVDGEIYVAPHLMDTLGGLVAISTGDLEGDDLQALINRLEASDPPPER